MSPPQPLPPLQPASIQRNRLVTTVDSPCIWTSIQFVLQAASLAITGTFQVLSKLDLVALHILSVVMAAKSVAQVVRLPYSASEELFSPVAG
jgi:hypothetical protein